MIYGKSRNCIMKDKAFIVAELSANHNHKKDIAIATIRAAKKAGADAVKLQTYTADTITLDCRKEDFMIHGGLWDGYCLHDLYKEAYTPWEWHEELFHVAREEGLICFSSPFDKTAVDFLESLGNPIYKIASFEITDIPLISYVASKKKPVVISTGIATLQDIEAALTAVRSSGNEDVTLLRCISQYPAPVEDANLLTIPDMRQRFGVKVGLSDHSIGNTLAVASVALGATMVEKHFILDRKIGGPDSAFSCEPAEFAEMVRVIRETEAALGNVCYPSDPQKIKGREFARSLYVAEDIRKGEVFTEKNVRSVRPGYGLSPVMYFDVLGKRANRDLEKGMPLRICDVEV